MEVEDCHCWRDYFITYSWCGFLLEELQDSWKEMGAAGDMEGRVKDSHLENWDNKCAFFFVALLCTFNSNFFCIFCCFYCRYQQNLMVPGTASQPGPPTRTQDIKALTHPTCHKSQPLIGRFILLSSLVKEL